MTVRRACVWLLLLLACAPSVAAAKKKPCHEPLSACPSRGCEEPRTAHAIMNQVKRNRRPKGEIKSLDFEDFRALQAEVEAKFSGNYHTLLRPDRQRLRALQIGGRTLGEGDKVEILGYIAVLPVLSNDKKVKPRANTGESVNCYLADDENNDFHINLTPQPGGSEYAGIVVEMIPQGRKENWTTDRLELVQDRHLKVRVRGQLFFDNQHTVNAQEGSTSRQPRRFSLWEIHPITEFDVCTKATCAADGGGWEKLETWTPGGGP